MSEGNSSSADDGFNLILSKNTSIFNDRNVNTNFGELFNMDHIHDIISYFSLYVIIYHITVLIYLYTYFFFFVYGVELDACL